jgi:hypothetical protein
LVGPIIIGIYKSNVASRIVESDSFVILIAIGISEFYQKCPSLLISTELLVKGNSNDILFALKSANSTPEKAPKPLSADFSSGAMKTLQRSILSIQ